MQEPTGGNGPVEEVERLAHEVAGELRGLHTAVTQYGSTIGGAARYIARYLAGFDILEAADPEGYRLARTLAHLAGIGEEIEQLLTTR